MINPDRFPDLGGNLKILVVRHNATAPATLLQDMLPSIKPLASQRGLTSTPLESAQNAYS